MSPGFGDRWLHTGWLVTGGIVRFQQGRGIRVKMGVDQYRPKENQFTWPIKQVNHILIWFSASLFSPPLTLILISYVSLSSHALLRKLLCRESHGSICSWYLPVPSPQRAACWCWAHGSDIRKQLFCYYVCHFISLCSFAWEDEVNSVMTFFFFLKMGIWLGEQMNSVSINVSPGKSMVGLPWAHSNLLIFKMRKYKVYASYTQKVVRG